MYAFIEGRVCEKGNGSLVIQAGGVGYLLTCSLSTIQAAPAVGEAMRCLRRLLEMDSTLVVAHNLMGYIYEDAYANYDSAMVCYRRAVALDSHFVKGYVNIGHLYYLDRKYEEANEYNRRALAIDSNYADAYFNLGWMANEQNYLHEAFGFMRKAAAKGSKAAREWLEKQEE